MLHWSWNVRVSIVAVEPPGRSVSTGTVRPIGPADVSSAIGRKSRPQRSAAVASPSSGCPGRLWGRCPSENVLLRRRYRWTAARYPRDCRRSSSALRGDSGSEHSSTVRANHSGHRRDDKDRRAADRDLLQRSAAFEFGGRLRHGMMAVDAGKVICRDRRVDPPAVLRAGTDVFHRIARFAVVGLGAGESRAVPADDGHAAA